MLLIDQRADKTKSDNFVIVAMTYNNIHNKPCKLVKLTRNQANNNTWDDKPLEKAVEIPDGKRSRVCDCYLIEQD